MPIFDHKKHQHIWVRMYYRFACVFGMLNIFFIAWAVLGYQLGAVVEKTHSFFPIFGSLITGLLLGWKFDRPLAKNFSYFRTAFRGLFVFTASSVVFFILSAFFGGGPAFEIYGFQQATINMLIEPVIGFSVYGAPASIVVGAVYHFVFSWAHPGQVFREKEPEKKKLKFQFIESPVFIGLMTAMLLTAPVAFAILVFLEVLLSTKFILTASLLFIFIIAASYILQKRAKRPFIVWGSIGLSVVMWCFIFYALFMAYAFSDLKFGRS